MQVLASAGFAAAGHLATDTPLKPISAGVMTMPSDAARFSTHTVPVALLVVNLPPKYGGCPLPASEVAKIDMPVLVALGSKDDVAGPADELAALMPHAKVLDIPGRDHMLAVGDKVFKNGVLQFLKERA